MLPYLHYTYDHPSQTIITYTYRREIFASAPTELYYVNHTIRRYQLTTFYYHNLIQDGEKPNNIQTLIKNSSTLTRWFNNLNGVLGVIFVYAGRNNRKKDNRSISERLRNSISLIINRYPRINCVWYVDGRTWTTDGTA